MTYIAIGIIAFWVGAVWCYVSDANPETLTIPALLTALFVLFFAARGLGWA